MIRSLVAPEREEDLISLDLAELEAGETFMRTYPSEAVAVVLGGVVDAHVDGRSLGQAGGRANVFEAAGDAIYAPPASFLRIVARTATRLAIATAPLGDGTPAQARVIRPDDQRIAEVGKDNWRRCVRTILGPDHRAGRLLLGETVTPPGNWSSYPPHKHDRQAPPEEVRLEEVYLFKVDPPGGFGVQVHYADRLQEAFIVREEDVAVIRTGYHPVVAAPGYSLYYLWVMAGDARLMIPYLDPAHSWIQET